MLTLSQPPLTVNDEAWRVAVDAEIDALPETIADVTDPYQVGWLDAEAGERSRPMHWYATLTDIELYIGGWNDANHIAARESRRYPSFQQAINDYRNGRPYAAFRNNYTTTDIKWYEIGWSEAEAEARRTCSFPAS